ncbi:MAG: hypothetical protein NC319_09180 [Butyricicoccus sp.]|nr:hypothetical protein [Butyricicoccus sp.]
MMLDSVVSAIIAALNEAGIGAVEAYPKKELCRLDGALVCVGVKSAKGLPAGFGGYLGLGADPETGRSEELYGARCVLELSLDIFAGTGAGAGECTRCAGRIPAALGALPEGIKISSLSFGAAAPDGGTGLFKCSGVLSGTAYFIARERPEDGVFSDFILRGSVKE